MRTLLSAVALSMMSLSAWAGGTAVLKSDADGRSQTMRVDYLGDKLRFDVDGEAQTHMVMRDGKMYAVTGQTVIDMSGMAQMFGQQAAANPGEMGSDVERLIGLHATGRTETVAGLRGEVHVLEYVDAKGKKRTEEVVLSNNARAWELTQAMERMARTFSASAGVDKRPGETELWKQLNGKRAGVLRYGSQMTVVSLSGKNPSSSRFELPSAPQTLPNLGAMGGASAQGGAGFDLGAVLGKKADRQQDRVEQRADQEVDEATDTVVDKALDKAFKKLFGN